MISISSKDNQLIKYIAKLNKSAKYRRENGEFVAEGFRICRDAVLSAARISSAVFSQSAVEKYSGDAAFIAEACENVYIVPDSLFTQICDTKTPQGVVCVIKTLDIPFVFGKIKSNGKFIALDNIQDPSNLGTILRTAEALGIDGVIMSADTCDIYSPKVVRGSMGAVFRLPFIVVDSIETFLTQHPQLKSYAAVVDISSTRITDVSFAPPCVTVIGNEGNGLKEETIWACDESITIPMDGRAESLNASVAASIIIWEMVK